jgi:hypothetical protein
MRFALFRFSLPHHDPARRDTPTGPHTTTSMAIGADAGANDVAFKPTSALTDADIAADAQRTSQSVAAHAGCKLNGAEGTYAKFRRRDLSAALGGIASVADGAASASVQDRTDAVTTSPVAASVPAGTNAANKHFQIGGDAATPVPAADVTRYCCQSLHYAPRLHAARLLFEIFTGSDTDEPVTPRAAQSAYAEVCGDLHWLPHTWNSVSRQLTLLSGGGKAYRVCCDYGCKAGSKRRRVFLPPSAAQLLVISEEILGRASPLVPEHEREQPWPGAPSAPTCPHVPYPCPFWKAPHGDH